MILDKWRQVELDFCMKKHPSIKRAPKKGGGHIPGPHLCSAVGTNVSTVLRAAMMEMCDHHNGTVSRDDINHVFDLVMNSSQLFFLYRQGYSTCVSLKDSPQFIDIDEMTITHFVVRSYCHDIITQVCRKQIAVRKGAWSAAFIDGLVEYLVGSVDPELPKRVFPVYQTLVTQQGGKLTPLTILNTPDMVSAFVKTAVQLGTKLHLDAAAAAQFEMVVNSALLRALHFKEPSPEKLDRPTSLAFLMGLTKASEKNPFRTAILKEKLLEMESCAPERVSESARLVAAE